MSDEFIDPLRDPRFPNRPQHPDYWKLSETVLKLDGRMDLTATAEKRADEFQRTVADVIDVKSLSYMAMQRAARLSDDPEIRSCLAAMYLEAFLVGVEYEKSSDD